MAKKEKRFKKLYTQNCGSVEVWVDKETGVNYLFYASGYAGGIVSAAVDGIRVAEAVAGGEK